MDGSNISGFWCGFMAIKSYMAQESRVKNSYELNSIVFERAFTYSW
jgi:hypothetical protein